MKINDILTELSQAERKRIAGVKNDQFFTRPQVAREFASWVKGKPFYKDVARIIDPCAGAKAVSRFFPGAEEYDLDPQTPDIIQQDFLTSNHRYQPGTLVIMNPPFGERSDLALAFFNKAATFADHIAQIAPRTFRRYSIQRRIPTNFHLVDEYVLPRGSFYLPAEGKIRKYDVPAVAQIWSRDDVERDITPPRQVSDLFRPVKDPQQADFAFRRVGRRAGQIIERDFEHENPNSFYFMQGDVNRFKKVDWSRYGNDVMGARNISLPDIVLAVE